MFPTKLANGHLLLLAVEVLAGVVEENNVGLANYVTPVARTAIIFTHL